MNAVEELLGDHGAARRHRAAMLADIYDLERIMTRIVYGSANARELRALSPCHAPVCRPSRIRWPGCQVGIPAGNSRTASTRWRMSGS